MTESKKRSSDARIENPHNPKVLDSVGFSNNSAFHPVSSSALQLDTHYEFRVPEPRHHSDDNSLMQNGNGMEAYDSMDSLDSMEVIADMECRDPLEDGYQSYILGPGGEVMFSPGSDADIGRSSRFDFFFSFLLFFFYILASAVLNYPPSPFSS